MFTKTDRPITDLERFIIAGKLVALGEFEAANPLYAMARRIPGVDEGAVQSFIWHRAKAA